MNTEYLVSMANDIGAFFASEAGAAEAPKSVASHITRFWDPRMRREIIAHFTAHGGEGLSEIAHKAIALLAERAAEAPTASH
ncbi:MAG TPA: formate dehydrogenase subunit delta [Steroidobacteraceae bacterium]|nr:formate dehydrogenase subunit delta [Steroidobacteraceae bacterium]